MAKAADFKQAGFKSKLTARKFAQLSNVKTKGHESTGLCLLSTTRGSFCFQIPEHDQVLILEALQEHRQEHRADQVSPDERVILITRASSALRCIHYDIEKSLSEHDLTQLDLDGEGEAPYTQELLHEHLDWIIKNESYGDFSRDASYFRGKILIVPDQRIQTSSICVY